VVNTDSASINREKGNCFEFADEPNPVEEFKSSNIWKRYADYILKSERIFFERASLGYFERRISGLFLVFVDVAANKVVKANEYTVGFYFLIPVVIFVSVMLIYILHFLQGIHYVLADKVYVDGTVGE
jgi:hypothetical protein